MNLKRWIALGVAALLLVISIGVNTLSSMLSSDFTSIFEEMMATSNTASEYVVEDGSVSDRIAVLTVDGVIQDTGQATSLFATAGYNHQFFMDQLEMIKEDNSIKGVVLKVNSPGGGVVESAQIYDKIMEIKEERQIPIYVSMGAMAASGGYYISAPADKIFVNKETMTGSIGVIFSALNYGEFADKYGFDFITIKTGPYKDMGSATREMTEEERALFQEMANDSYETFVDVIEQGRGMSEAEVKKIADGRIMNGRQAVESGLADDYGYAEDVVAAIKTDLGIENAQVFEYGINQDFTSLFAMKASSLFGGSLETELMGQLLADYSAPRMMYLYGEM
ncbi:signal peptide peptidase SppA [Chungangia koreensis]|uniref:Signal peptide peptidase SppA n=1 Tax=Chungangia koreensis TaxID=752657 RepID=A0ABV8X3B0_9LACT